MADAPPASDALAKLKEAELQIRAVLDEMAVVPNTHRTRLLVALRLIEDARVDIAKLDAAA